MSSPSCHGESAPAQKTLSADTGTVMLVGNPNVGKSTLFNRVTGARQHVVNAPGTTVDIAHGTWAGQPVLDLVDLPGTYSLIPDSPDEVVTVSAVAGGQDVKPDLVVVLADATALSRSLYLVAQTSSLDVPCLVALTMADVARSRGVGVDADALSRRIGVPVVAINPRTGAGMSSLHDAIVAELATEECCRPRATGIPLVGWDKIWAPVTTADALRSQTTLHLDWVADVVADLEPQLETRQSFSDRIDRVLLNPWIGIPVFLVVVWAIFQLTTTVAAPIQDALSNLVTGPGSDLVRGAFGIFGLAHSWPASFLTGGVLAGLGTILSFVPLMAIMFFCLGLLEDSGYMARAAFVMDRAMRFIGLDGRSFLPFIVGFGCNVPALDATKTLPNARQRLLTGLLIPFTSCSARLTVYLLIAATFFPRQWAGTVVFAMYVASILLIIGFGVVLRHTWFRDLKRGPLVLQLPAYHVPAFKPLLVSVWVRLEGFLFKAGKIILATLVVVWLLQAVPMHAGAGSFGHVADVHASLYGAIADTVAPIFTWSGFANWSFAMALIAGFVAKEVVIGTMGQAYAIDPTTNEAGLQASLQHAMTIASGGHAAAGALAFMIFVLAYTPCLTTVVEQRRLFGLKAASASVASSIVVAWVLSVVVFQVAKIWL